MTIGKAQGIGRVILFAKDMAAMSDFYRDVLGMLPLGSEHASEDWQPFETGGDCEFALHAIGDEHRDKIEIADPPDPRYGSPTKFVLRVEDAGQARDALREKGVRFANAGSSSASPLVRFDILDPEGNVVQISQDC